MKIEVDKIIKNDEYLHGVLTDEERIFDLIADILGNNELNSVINEANKHKPFYRFMRFHNFVGILTYHNQVFQLNIFEYDSLDTALDQFPNFKAEDWTESDREMFSLLVHESINSVENIKLEQL